MSTQEFSTIDEMAAKWKISTKELKAACENEEIPGAALLNGTWIVPTNAARPHIQESSLPTEEQAPADSNGEIVPRSPLQKAVLDIISEGENLSSVMTQEIGGTTYVVCGITKRQGLTAEERIARLLDRATNEHFYNLPERDYSDFRKKSPVFTCSKEEKMEDMRKLLTQCGFEPEEIETLMGKVEKDYEAPQF